MAYAPAMITSAHPYPTPVAIQNTAAIDRKNRATAHNAPISRASDMAVIRVLTFSAAVSLQYSSFMVPYSLSRAQKVAKELD